jgi:two-component system response regulator RegX3
VNERILLVEDEPAIADSVAYTLAGEGYAVETVGDGEAALAATRTRDWDLLVLDVVLPRLSGVEVCRRVRAESAVPILMLTARSAEVDRVLGLEAGADDYVPKPFSMAELVSRVRAILRRRQLDRTGEAASLRVGALTLDLVRHSLTVDGRSAAVTPSELKLLALLAAQPDRVFGRREIMQHLWDSSYIGDERAADVHVKNVRRKIERDPARPKRLVTVRGAGYKLVAV